MPRAPTFFTALSALLATLSPLAVRATPCIAFDANFNLYALGFGTDDFQLGTQDSWSSSVTPTKITTSGRPPFDGTQTTCYLSQFQNAIYVLDGDKSNPTAVHLYDATAKSWSTQSVSSGGPDPTSLVTILDHDTNVFYALAGGKMSSLDMGTMKSASGSALSWNDVGNPTSFDASSYKPTMALAQNHIHFIGAPNSQAGQAFIYVIHFSFFQPAIQSYTPSNGGSAFPSSHGQTASFFKTDGVQTQFAFVPDAGGSTYVIDVNANSSLAMAAPPVTGAGNTYAASTSALVQLTTDGKLAFVPYTPGDASTSASAKWSSINVQGLPSVAPNSTSSAGGSSSTGGSSNSSGSGSNGGGSSGGKSGNNGAGRSVMAMGWLGVVGAIVGGLVLL